jgi:hypothetical protein
MMQSALADVARAADVLLPVLVAALFGMAWLIVIAWVPRGQNADDLLPAIIATQKLTLYYWGENRFANLLPALTAWIVDPERNAWVQVALRIAAALVAPLFFCALYHRRARHVWAAAVCALALFLLTASLPVLHETAIVATPYGTALTCAALALLILRRSDRMPAGKGRGLAIAVGALVLLVAHLVNVALGVLVLPMLATLWLLWPSGERLRFLMLNVAAAVLAFLAPTSFAPDYYTRTAVDLTLTGPVRFAGSIAAGTGALPGMAVLLPLIVAAVVIRTAARRRCGGALVSFAAATVAGAAVVFGMAGFSRHVALNDYHFRYFVPALFALYGLGGIAVWEAVRWGLSSPRPRALVLALLGCMALLGARNRLAASGAHTPDLIVPAEAPLARAVAARSMELDGIVGNYWHVWPAVFAANGLRFQAGQPPDLLGVTQRGEARRDAFVARLTERGSLRLGCIDFSVRRCQAEVTGDMTLPALTIQEIAAPEAMPDGHVLRFITISLPQP